ncbi:MAG: HEAT repeat domain-containing protein [Planctomycetota bacterium]
MPTSSRLFVLSVLLTLAGTAWAGWGADVDPETGRTMLHDVQKDLLPMLRADEAERAVRIDKFVRRSAEGAIEALKRFRNPEFLDLFDALLDHRDWHVQHRALLVLEHTWDPAAMPRAWALLDSPEPRLREKAAITCIRLFDGSRSAADVDALLAREEDFYVREALLALKHRAEGTLPVERLGREVVVTVEGGLLLTPFLQAFDRLDEVAPGSKPAQVRHVGQARRGRRQVADRWVAPLLGYGEEEVVGAPLQPFGNLQADGNVYHVGEDVGACLDGAGFYAPAAGVVRMIQAGSDRGTVIVLEHELRSGKRVCSVLMHGGDTVFVEAGERVHAGQLLTSMGLSYSIENGGHFAHLHLGFYPGPFQVTRDQGDQPVKDGLADWYDPQEFLPAWIERTRPIVEVLRPLAPALASAAKRLAREEFGPAYGLTRKVLDEAGTDEAAKRDATWLLQELEDAPDRAGRRARAWRKAGFPGEALRVLETYVTRCRGIPDVAALEETIAVWKEESGFQKALKGEARVAAAEKKSARAKDPSRMRSTWEKLARAFGDTCLAPRIESQLVR